MISWSIEAAHASECFDRVIVSTDDLEILRIAEECGAEVPFLRPESLSDDFVGTTPVVAHTIKWLRDAGENPLQVCCIYATAPFLAPSDIKTGLQRLEETSSHYVFSVTGYRFPIQRALKIRRDGRLEMFQPKYFSTRSQDLEEAYHDAGQFYWGISDAWIKEEPIFSPLATPVILPSHRVQDIDTLEDWRRAELMFMALRNV